MIGKKEKINELTKELLQSGDITDVISLQRMLKEMLKQGVETLLESELDEELGYPKHNKPNRKKQL